MFPFDALDIVAFIPTCFGPISSYRLHVWPLHLLNVPTSLLRFLIVHTIMTGAVQSAGFHLAMSDMVLEMKRNHAVEGRLDEPSLAGLFMGANALLCKPMESVLPIVAAYFLGNTDFSTNEQSESAKNVLFYLLVVPPLGMLVFATRVVAKVQFAYTTNGFHERRTRRTYCDG